MSAPRSPTMPHHPPVGVGPLPVMAAGTLVRGLASRCHVVYNWNQLKPCRFSYHAYMVIFYLTTAALLISSASSAASPSSRGWTSSVSRTLSPYNLTITMVKSRVATVHWDPTPAIFFPSNNRSTSSTATAAGSDYLSLPPITGFRVTLRPTFSGGNQKAGNSNRAGSISGVSPTPSSALGLVENSHGQRVVDLDGLRRSFIFQDLRPRTEYQVVIVAYSSDGRGNVSDTVTFTTLNDDESVIASSTVRPSEVVLVVLILVAWFCAIALFLHQWGKIRVIQPREPRFKHSPKNLDTIKVVKKPTDSVIHKHYTRQFSRTMLMRETKRIERMNTMPNIKVNLDNIKEQQQQKHHHIYQEQQQQQHPRYLQRPYRNLHGGSAELNHHGACTAAGSGGGSSGSGHQQQHMRSSNKFHTMPDIELENLSASSDGEDERPDQTQS